MASLWQDLRHALRLIRRSPAFSSVVVFTLALGIGANTAIFTLLDAVLLRPLPVPHSERLVEIAPIYRFGPHVPISYALFQQIDSHQRGFSALFGWSGGLPRNVEVNCALSLLPVRGVTGNYYQALGATPLYGRLITSADANAIPGSNVAVLGYEFWQQRFGGDPRVVGSAIAIDGQPFTIVGVSRRWFMGMTPGEPADITVPFNAGPFASSARTRSLLYIFVTGRLADGVTIEQARTQLQSFWHDALVATAPTAVPGPRLQSWLNMGLQLNQANTGISRTLRERFARPLRVLMVLVVIILAVACVNLASLALARTAARRREMSVRIALGASRIDIVRQFVTEQLLLSLAGLVLAFVFASWASRLLLAWMDEGTTAPFVLDLTPDWRVFGFAALAAVATTMLIALTPAWQSSRQAPGEVLRTYSRTIAGGASRLGRALIVAQIALSLVLVFGAALLLRTLCKPSHAGPEIRAA